MKKIIAVVISLVLLLSFSGCTSEDNIVKEDHIVKYDSKEISIEELKNDYPEFFNLSTDGGLTVYIWQMSENNYRCYLTNTHIDAASDESFAFEKGATMEEMRAILFTYDIDRKDITIRTEVNLLSSYYYKIDDEYQARVKELFWNDSWRIWSNKRWRIWSD